MPPLDDRIQLQQADITTLDVDAIVNAANSQLAGGGGVDGAIHRAAGPELAAACQQLGGCPTGHAKLTPGFNLPARHVIHAVGPVFSGGDHNEAELLANCYRRSLALAAEHNLRSIAFSALSTGVYGYPFEEAERIAFTTVDAALADHPDIEQVIFVFFSADQLARAQAVFDDLQAAD